MNASLAAFGHDTFLITLTKDTHIAAETTEVCELMFHVCWSDTPLLFYELLSWHSQHETKFGSGDKSSVHSPIKVGLHVSW